jgi:hypothetical protein
MLSRLTINVLLAEHQPPKILRRRNRSHLKSDNGNSGRVEHRILFGTPTARGLATVRPIVELYDALHRRVRVTNYKICTQSIVTIQNGLPSAHVLYFHEPAQLNLRQHQLFREGFD